MVFLSVFGYINVEVKTMWMNPEKAGALLNRNPRLLRQWAAEGKVEGVFKVGAAWVAPFEAWKAASDEVRKPGPKPKSP